MAAETKKKENKLQAWFKGLKGEFSRIIWPTKNTIIKQTTVVVIVTVILGILISLIDNAIQLGLDQIVK